MIELVTAADKNYLFYLSCHLSSIGRRSETYKITVIHRDIDPSYQKELGKLIPAPHELHWFKPNVDHLKKIGAPLFFANSSPHYFRLLCPYLLSASSRVLYLDADTFGRSIPTMDSSSFSPPDWSGTRLYSLYIRRSR